VACTITILETTLIATTNNAGEVARIDVEGDVAGCDELKVSLHDNSAGIDIGSVTVVPDAAGHWKAAFVHGQGFDLKGALCGDKIEIVAECTKSHDDEKCEDKREVPLPCQPGGGGGCPSVAVTVTPGNCNAAGTSRAITFAVTVGGGAQIQYMWNFGDGTPLTALAPGSGSFSQTHSYPVGATAATYNANLIVVVPPGCTASPDPIIVTVQPCGATSACPDNPRFVAELHLPGNQRDLVDLEAPCVPAGDYTVSLSNSYPAGTSLFWTVDEAPAGQGASIEVTIAAGESVDFEVIATKDGCPPQSETVILSACRECPTENELVLERRLPGAGRERVPVDEGCIAAGNYVVRLIEPTGDLEIDWFEDGVFVEGQHGSTLRVRVAECQTLTVSAIVTIPGCPDLNPAITIAACCCPEVSLTVLDADGDVVDPAQCVAPGTYTVRAEGDDLDDESTDLSWSINGQAVAGNGTERDVRVAAPVSACCSDGVPVTTVSLTVTTPGCDPQTVAVSLRPCAEFVFNTCCQIFGTLVLLLFGLTVVAAALALCPQVLIVPPAVAFFVAFGLLFFLALLFLLIIAVLVWFVICPPNWCRDILPKLWQGALIAGITFIYFGSCPLCLATPIGSLLPWGVGLLLLGAGLLLLWILTCRPTQCETVWRLVELGVVNTVIGVLEMILAGACTPLIAEIFLWLVTLFLDVLVFLLPQFCGFNPIAPAAFALFRRPPSDPRRSRALRRLAGAASDAAPRAAAASPDPARPGGRTKAKHRRDCGCGGT
jgi:hypothetical protein